MTKLEYQQKRGEIKTGDVFFTAGKSLFSRCIRVFTQSQVSHTGLFLRLGNRLFIVESLEGSGCRMLPASAMYKEITIIGKIETQFNKKEIKDRALDKIGSDYDLIGALFSLIWDTESKKVFCSEFVSDVLDLRFPYLNRGILPIDIANKLDKTIYE